MHFTSAAVAAFLLAAAGNNVGAFSQHRPSAGKLETRGEEAHVSMFWRSQLRELMLFRFRMCPPAPAYSAFIATGRTSAATKPSRGGGAAHPAGCHCPSCARVAAAAFHPVGCLCGACASRTALFADAVAEGGADTAADAGDEDVPAEVEALDGIESSDEAHNAERPARKSLKKKGPRGKPLSEFTVGETITGKVKSVVSYGAFLDIGAQTDGLLHISQLSVDYVSDVQSVLEVGQEVQVRILNVDEKKSQVALTLLSEEDEQKAKESSGRPKQQQQRQDRPKRRDDGAVLTQLSEKGWSTDQFVEGTVVSTVDFGAFVRVDASQLNPDVEGELDGLVHISALTPGRADSVTSIVNVNDKVKVRVKGLSNNKVSLSMISPEDEREAAEARGNRGGGGPSQEGNKEWRKDMESLTTSMPKFENRPMVVDLR